MGYTTEPAGTFVDDVTMFRTCEQCGLCSSACPITGREGYNIRRILRHVELGLVEEIADTAHPWACTTCGRCEGVCPNGIAILDIIRPLRARAPERYVPRSAPCVEACPAGVDIPGYVRLVAEGRYDEACGLILEKVPFPGVLGRVCTHPCETVCRRGEVNEAVSICALKRFAADRAGDVSRETAAPDTGRRVAVVGAGPAGLTAAHMLRRKGHGVTVFDSKPKPGGMMRYGIPRYRLPEAVIDRDIDRLLASGIELVCGRRLGSDFTLEDLTRDGFDAVFLATGLWSSRSIPLEGADAEDVLGGIDFLIGASEGEGIRMKDRVLVVGGGNVAVDVALTALRLGAGQVAMACLESRQEMPANPWEIQMAEEEGVVLMPSWGPRQIMTDRGAVMGVTLVRCTSVFDSGGNFCPAFDEETRTVEADQVILAIGQTADPSFLADGAGSLSIERDLIVVDEETLATSVAGVFAGGDAAGGPGTIVEAVAAGTKGARAVDRFLGGDGIMETPSRNGSACDGYDGTRQEGFADLRRQHAPVLPLSERRCGFSEVDLCLGEEQAVAEAGRCFQCDCEIALARRLREDL